MFHAPVDQSLPCNCQGEISVQGRPYTCATQPAPGVDKLDMHISSF